jgi:hypothetical protein
VSRQLLYVLLARYEQRKKVPVIERIMDGEHSGRPAHKRELVMSELKILLLSISFGVWLPSPTLDSWDVAKTN